MKKRYVFQTLLLICLTACGSKDEFDATGTFEATEIVVSSEEWEQKTIEAIQKAAFTGEVGDGKIFSYEIRSAQKIRTGETGYDALQSNN